VGYISGAIKQKGIRVMNAKQWDDKKLIETLTEIVESMQKGWDENDIEKFSKDFSDEMRAEITFENFKEQRDRLYPVLGNHVSLSCLALHKNPTELVLMLTMVCEKRDAPVLLVYNFRENEESFTIVGASIHA